MGPTIRASENLSPPCPLLSVQCRMMVLVGRLAGSRMKAARSAARAALNPPRSLFTFATDVKGVSFSFFLFFYLRPSPPPPPFATSERSLWVSSPPSFSMQSCKSRERERKKKSSEKLESACFATRLKPTLVINFLPQRAVKQSTKHLEEGGNSDLCN